MDEDLRRRARAARAEIEAQVDVETDLAGRPTRPTTSGIAPITPLPPRGRIVAIAGSIAAVAVAIVGGVVLFRGPSSIETSEPSAPIASVGATTTTFTPSVGPMSTSAVPTTTIAGTPVAPTTTVVPSATTTTTVPAPTGTASVSYLDSPPAVTLTPLGVVPVPEPTAGMYQVAIGDLGVAVSTRTYEPATARLDIIGFDGTTRSFDGDSYDNVIAYGPGDVVYTTTGEPLDDFAVAAIPVSGDLAGEVVASEPAGVNEHLEYPPASYGHGATGVAMRRYEGKIAIEYVDIDGNPTTLDAAPTYYDSDPREVEEGQVTVAASTGTSWSLSIDAHPDGAGSYVGPSPAAPTTGGDGAIWTHIGPDLAPETDFGEPSQWVVAQLGNDGSATWWSLLDGWTIAASDIWGTVAVRQQGEQLEVALVDFAPVEPASIEPKCTDDDIDVQAFIADLIADRRAGELVRSRECLGAIPAEFTGPAPRCWSSCEGWEQTLVDDPVNVLAVETPDACCVQRSFSLFVSYRQGDKVVDVTEVWTLELVDNGLGVRSVGFEEPVYTREEAVDTLTTYLGHIGDEAWTDAALMLDDGAINSDERSDLAQLDLDDYAIDSVAAALEAWCADGCVTDVPTAADLTWDGSYGIGRSPERIFVAWYEGTRSIYGLPIQSTRSG